VIYRFCKQDKAVPYMCLSRHRICYIDEVYQSVPLCYISAHLFLSRMNEVGKTQALNEMRRRISTVAGESACSQYLKLIMGWLSNEISIATFDKQGQACIGARLHSDFLLRVSDILEIDLEKQQKRKELPSSSRLIATNEYGNSLRPLTSNSLPDNEAIEARCLLYSWAYGIDEIASDVPTIIEKNLTRAISNLLEESLRLTRPHVDTDIGFTHSYGVDRSNGLSTSTNVRCIVPAREPIHAEDLLDVLELNTAAVRNQRLRGKLLQRLEQLDS
jgi:hypothetical protein